MGNWQDGNKVNVALSKISGKAYDRLKNDSRYASAKTWKLLKELLEDLFTPKEAWVTAEFNLVGTIMKDSDTVEDYTTRIEEFAQKAVRWTGDAAKDAVLKEDMENRKLSILY